jgi:hypothetical protein
MNLEGSQRAEGNISFYREAVPHLFILVRKLGNRRMRTVQKEHPIVRAMIAVSFILRPEAGLVLFLDTLDSALRMTRETLARQRIRLPTRCRV